MNDPAQVVNMPRETEEEKTKRKARYLYQFVEGHTGQKAVKALDTRMSPRNRPGTPAIDFYVFSDLPVELQEKIWEAVCFQSPATIDIRVTDQTFEIYSPLPKFPNVLHATSGARAIALRFYEVLSEDLPQLNPDPANASLNPQAPDPGPAGSAPQDHGNNPNAGNRMRQRRIYRRKPGTILLSAAAQVGPFKFYVNFSADMFAQVSPVLHMAGDVSYYPTLSLPGGASARNPERDGGDTPERRDITRNLRALRFSRRRSDPPQFPNLDMIPSLFNRIENLVLMFLIPDWLGEPKFSEWADREVNRLLTSPYVRTSVCRFPFLHRVDFEIFNDDDSYPLGATLTLKHLRFLQIRELDGISLDRAQVAVLQRSLEDEMERTREELGKEYLESARLVAFVEDKAWDCVTVGWLESAPLDSSVEDKAWDLDTVNWLESAPLDSSVADNAWNSDTVDGLERLSI